MNTFALEIFDDEGAVCTLYTVRILEPESEYSETDKFLLKYENDELYSDSLQELVMFIDKKIANDMGALRQFFRFEKTAEALPPYGAHKIDELTINFVGFPLRLYCLRISDSLLILFNGGEKTAETAQEGKTSMVFHEANRYAEKILKALKSKEIIISSDGRSFESWDGNNEIVIY